MREERSRGRGVRWGFFAHFFYLEMGVSVKMITGDQLVIAKEVSHRLGLPRTILPASKLNDPTVSIEELTNR